MNVAEKPQIRGRYTALALSRDLLPNEIDLARRYVRGEKHLANRLPIQREYVAENVVPDTGKNVLARLLCGDTTYTGEINYGAFGSGSAAFNTSSMQLNTEVYRKLVQGAAADTGTVAYIDWFIAVGDVANQTFNEFGAFIDGTGSANTGRAMSLLLTGGWVKSGAMFVTLAVSFT